MIWSMYYLQHRDDVFYNKVWRLIWRVKDLANKLPISPMLSHSIGEKWANSGSREQKRSFLLAFKTRNVNDSSEEMLRLVVPLYRIELGIQFIFPVPYIHCYTAFFFFCPDWNFEQKILWWVYMKLFRIVKNSKPLRNKYTSLAFESTFLQIPSFSNKKLWLEIKSGILYNKFWQTWIIFIHIFSFFIMLM